MSIPNSSSHVTPGRQDAAKALLRVARTECDRLWAESFDADNRRTYLVVLARGYEMSIEEISLCSGLTTDQVRSVLKGESSEGDA